MANSITISGAITPEIIEEGVNHMNEVFKVFYAGNYTWTTWKVVPIRATLHSNDQVAIDFLNVMVKLKLTTKEFTNDVSWLAPDVWRRNVHKRIEKYKGPVRSRNASKIY